MRQLHTPIARAGRRRCAALLLASALLPGCVAWEIRDEMRVANEHLCQIKPAMALTLRGVEQANARLDRADERLVEVQAALAQAHAQIADVHRTLTHADERLGSVGGSLEQTHPKLSDVHATLRDVHKAIAPLSTAMGSLGSVMSMLGMSDQATDAAAPAADPARPSEPAVAGPSTDAAAASPAPATKAADPILGTWITVYPPPTPPARAGRVYVFTDDGRFLTSEGAAPPVSGRWSRYARTLTLTLDSPTSPNASAAAPETVEVLTLTSRTLTVRTADALRVHARP